MRATDTAVAFTTILAAGSDVVEHLRAGAGTWDGAVSGKELLRRVGGV